ncbi:metal-dependent hydrolase family protein [Qingshengfaniella alkalisoli]|uniref:Amidohydrolase family protein n=1 Tax=Qingshengfaniella alkalisoli TaxID=2599296 RepID=A0A5B8J8Q7_9RHOB|nr:amidohydrolase family protein [Qingshengfaniella alkalisoli]QDY70650.1 amidohydrolase family protein [Qingshengfaniella alkalisoli]
MSMKIIRNARIVDGSTDRASDPKDIVIENGRFREVADKVTITAETEIDAAGHHVLPGLIDCHVHVIATDANLGANAEVQNSLLAYRAMGLMKNMIMRGFTTVRDLGGADQGIVDAIEERLITAPRLVICGKALSQTGGHTDYRGRYNPRSVEFYRGQIGAMGRVVDGVDDVRRACREEIKAGATFIKVMANGGVSSPTDPIGFLGFSMAELEAAVEEARNAETYVSGHLYTDEAINRALDAGFYSIEHANLIKRETVKRVVEAGAAVIPTNITYELLAKDGARFGLPPESVEKVSVVLDAGIEALTMLHEEGALMGYGSDLLGGMQPHQSGEFELRGRHIPAHDVIRSATLDAAKVMRMDGQIGAIKEGAFADLIFVDGNPLDDLTLLADQGAHMPVIMKDGALVKNSL